MTVTKTFYEVLWAIAQEEKLIDKWIYEEKLLFNGTSYSWTPKALRDLEIDKVVGDLQVTPRYTTTHLNTSIATANPPDRDFNIPPTWLAEFIGKFTSKNLGVAGKTSDKSSVVKRLIRFLTEHDYTLEEILKATDLYISTLKSQGSIKFIRECGYFIYKKIDGVDQSDLAKWCEEIRTGGGSVYTSHQIL